ncbi:MAG: DUF362 domain-containing protein [Nitrospira sp.]|nr:DUF362 domain-containing protein [Nitrospira sp.]
MPKVSLIKGENRREIIKRSLEIIAGDIKNGLKSRQVIIKPNFVSTSIQLASSHVDQMRGILDFLKEVYKSRVIIAEAACGDTMKAYDNFGYLSLLKEYDVELLDLNRGPFMKIPIRDQINRTIDVRISSLLLDKNNYLISAAKLKVHDAVVVTLSIKNMAMGSIFVHDKTLVHQGFKKTNVNIVEIAKHVWPDLSVIDGFVGMEGDGPTYGTQVFVGIAISSTDPLAADRVACEVMSVDFNKVGYLYYCSEKGLGEADLNSIDILGRTIRECIRPFRLHSTVNEQYRWRN